MTETAAAVCPYCRAGFETAGANGEPADEVKLCSACNTPHHADCFAENGGCTIFGCTAAPADEAKISITPTDFHPPHLAPQGNSYYNLNAPVPPPLQSAPPPPPMPDGSFPSPPPAIVPYYQPQPFPAYAYGSYVKPKSRVAFVLLAVFLGSFGAHNFYAGYTKKAVIQLCITLCTCFWASAIPWIWAIIEACTINVDDDGVLLS
ncbi:NINE protein [Granulicella arctica]|uniref:NINE protein n=1 Tax=Granulicella arctica TaxID=940613 RepID=UPI0021DF7E58|nr:NINE protein [Granulicella arctica]